VILVVVVAIAGVGAYLFVFAVPSSSGFRTSPTIGAKSSPAGSAHAYTSTRLGSAQSYEKYRGTFTYSNPLGPFGIDDSSGHPVEWNSTQTASGSFAFSIDPTTYLGTGNGQGNITVATHGYCTGSVTVPYTFTIQVAHPPGANFEISFNTPNPTSATVDLACHGPTTGFNTANNPVTFLSVYPNGLSVASFPSTSSQLPTGGISYNVTITQSS